MDLQDFAPFFYLNVRFDALQKTFRLGNVSTDKKFDSFYQGDMTLFREFNRLFVWMMYFLLRNPIVFLIRTMYILLGDLIVFFCLG